MADVIEIDGINKVKKDTEQIIKDIAGVADSVNVIEFIPIEKLENLFGNKINISRTAKKGSNEQYFTLIADSFPSWGQFDQTNPVSLLDVKGPVLISSFNLRGLGLNMTSNAGRAYVRLTMDDVVTGFMVRGSGQGYNNWGGPSIAFSSSNAGNENAGSSKWPTGGLYSSSESSVLRKVKTTKPIYCKKLLKLEYALVRLNSLTENYGSGVDITLTYNVLGG